MGSPSGPGTHIREVIGAFEQAGHEVIRYIAGGEKMEVVSAPAIPARWWRKLIPTFIRETIKDYRLLQWDNQQFDALCEIIRREKPDLIYERGYYLMTSGIRVAQQYGIRHFLEINAPYPEEKAAMSGKGFYHSTSIKMERFQARNTDHLFVVSTALKEYYISRCDIDSAKITVTPNAVNAAMLSNQQIQSGKEDLNMPQDSIVIGFVGSIFPYHGVDALIRSFASVKQGCTKNLRLLIVGDGEVLRALKELATAMGVQDQTIFTGNVRHQDIVLYLQCMDICVMAKSNWYGSPVKIFEYGALQKAIIAPDVVPVLDVMQHRVHGWLVHDEEALELGIRTLIED
ncbi:MAG: glycosyltransferase family 4 protein, partial [Flavobacteriales bacterium]